jgi:predicted nucleic acid-binding protein
MKIYLDNCCFNRPYDDQTQLKIFLEAQAKLSIQDEIIIGKHSLVWSFILEYENKQNPYDIRRQAISEWKEIAKQHILLNNEIVKFGRLLHSKGVKSKDAYHLACAVYAECDVFLTTDKKLLKTQISEIKILNPIDYIREEKEA